MEMLAVITIIAILALMSLPSYSRKIIHQQVREGIKLAEPLKQQISGYYQFSSSFPLDNSEAGLPEPDKLISPVVSGIIVDNGALHIVLGKQANKSVHGKIISLRPVVVEGSPMSPHSWICGKQEVPEGMKTVSDDRTSLENSELPLECR